MRTFTGTAPGRRGISLITAFSLLAWLALSAPPIAAATTPTAVVVPSTAAPGETVTLSGSGWPPGASVGASFTDATMPTVAVASLGPALAVDAAGNFSGRASIPLTLFGNGSRGNLNVVPGRYLITVGGGTNPQVQVPFTVGAPAQGTLIWGSVAFDANGNGVRDAADVAAAGVGVSLTPSAGGAPAEAITDAFGRYAILGLAAGSYAIASQAAFQSAPYAGKTSATAVVGQAVRADLLLTAVMPQQLPPPATPGSRPAPSPSRVPARLPATGGGGAHLFAHASS